MKVQNICGKKIVVSELGLEMIPDQQTTVRDDGKHKFKGVEYSDIDIVQKYVDSGILQIIEGPKPSKSDGNSLVILEKLEKLEKSFATLEKSNSTLVKKMNELIEVINSTTVGEPRT